MWNAENDDLEEEDQPNPVICPMCRETVLKFEWKGAAPTPAEIIQYNERYEEYHPHPTTRTTNKFSSGIKAFFIDLSASVIKTNNEITSLF